MSAPAATSPAPTIGERAWHATSIHTVNSSTWSYDRPLPAVIVTSQPALNAGLQSEPCIDCHQQMDMQGLSSGHESVARSGKQQLFLYSLLLQQLDTLGWSKIAEVSPGLSRIALQLQDGARREHNVTVQLPVGFPAAAPNVAISLPRPFRLKWLPGYTLTHLVAQLEQVFDSYQPLWEQLEDLDCHTQLLDPPQVLAQPYSNCSRCIALGNGASCQLQLSPAAPKSLPTVTFHGPSSVVAVLQNTWYSSAHAVWDEARSTRKNIQAVLQLQLPPPKPGSKKGCAAARHAASAAEGDDADMPEADDAGYSSDLDDGADAGSCAICYSLHLADPSRPDELGDVADVECSSCQHLFHSACLAEWLGALPDSRRVFDTLFGTCPFCHNSIGVSTKRMRA